MATHKPNTPAERNPMPAQTSAKWAPPANAERLELSEFVTWKTVGDVVLGRVQAGSLRERPDPLDNSKIMQSVVVSPAAFIPAGDPNAAQVYHSLALGLSAHLQLLLPNVRAGGSDGKAFAIVFDGLRPSDTKGKQPSRQFNVYRLTDAEFRAELAKIGDVDDLPF